MTTRNMDMYFIEQIMTGRAKERIMRLGSVEIRLKKTPDKLCISRVKRQMPMNKLHKLGYLPWYMGWLPLGYRQVGVFDVQRPHGFKEFQPVRVRLAGRKIASVEPIQ